MCILCPADHKIPVWSSWKELNAPFEKKGLKMCIKWKFRGESNGQCSCFLCMRVAALLLGEAWESGDVVEEHREADVVTLYERSRHPNRSKRWIVAVEK